MRSHIPAIVSRPALVLALSLLFFAPSLRSPALALAHEHDMNHGAMHDAAPAPKSANIGGPFALVNQDGEAVTEATYRGQYLLVYFGYTFCPDLCPTGLQSMAQTLDRLGKDADKVQPLFITVDPARDTPAKLKDYVAAFHPKTVGLTGTPAQIAAVAKAYKVYYKKAEEVDDGEYMMDHSTGIYLMAPDGRYLEGFRENEKPDVIIAALRKAWRNAATKKP